MSDLASGQPLKTDKEGFLMHLDQWKPAVAEHIAAGEGIELGEPHWEIIHLIRGFYATYQVTPAMRPLVKYVRQQLGEDKGNSIYLLSLFPGSPPKLAAKIAGLPRPANCL